jgi:hypothetical protein
LGLGSPLLESGAGLVWVGGSCSDLGLGSPLLDVGFGSSLGRGFMLSLGFRSASTWVLVLGPWVHALIWV